MKFDFLELFNAIGYAQKVVTKDYQPAESLDTPISEDVTGLDSLDVTLTFFVIGEAYGIPEGDEMQDLWPVDSIRSLQTFVEAYKTKDPEDEFESIETLVKELA